MALRRSVSPRFLAAVTLLLLAGATRAEEESASREARSAQLIFNALRMSSDSGSPIAPLIAKYRRQGTSAAGVGYRGEELYREGRSTFLCSAGVTWLNETGLALTLDQAADQLGAQRIGSDHRTGATVYVVRDAQGKADRVLFLLRQGNVQLHLMVDRSEEDAEEMTRRSVDRWRFLVEEAKRLGIFAQTDPPRCTLRVWDTIRGEWQVLAHRQAFARRLARLRKEENLLLEVEVDSASIARDVPYEFEVRVQRGAERLQLREADGTTPLADTDGDGWGEVRVEPVDGEHPPRRLTVHFGAEPADRHAMSQKGAVAVRYADDSGQVEHAIDLVRAGVHIAVTHFELRAVHQSALFDLWVRGMTAEDAEEFRATRLVPTTWFNGVWDSRQDLHVSWSGYSAREPGEEDIEGLWWRVAVTGQPVGSQFGAVGLQHPYLGWARDLRSEEGLAGRPQTGFLVIEDRPDEPLQVGPFARRAPVDVYVEIALLEDLAAEDAVGLDARARAGVEREIEVRRLLEIGSGERTENPLEISIWQVDDLTDLKDESGRTRSLTPEDSPRIKEGLRKPTGEPVRAPSGDPLQLFFWKPGDSRDLESYFPLSADRIGRPLPFGPEGSQLRLPLDLEPGVYELRFHLSLQARHVEDGAEEREAWSQHVALRFWVLDLPALDEIIRLDGLDTERRPPPPSPRELHHEDPAGALREASKTGDVAALSAALRAGADPNAADGSGATPLGWATSLGHREAVRALLDAGAKVDHQTARGQSALNVAAARDDREMVRLLLQAGVDANERIRGADAPDHLKGATAIFLAALHGEGAALAELVGAGADPNATNARGATVLHLAAERGDASVVGRLLKAGADPKRVDTRGVTALMTAAHGGSAECVWVLIDAGADPNVATSTLNPGPYAGTTALMAAAEAGHETTVVALLLSGAKADARSFEGQTALDIARTHGHSKVVAILDRPHDARNVAVRVFQRDIEDAAARGRWDFVEMLVAHGMDANAPDERGTPFLVRAVRDGEVATLKGLLAVGAAVDARDQEYGVTALMEAAFRGKVEVVRLLVEAGADPDLQARGDSEGEAAGTTALMAAALAGNAEIVEMLLKAGADRRIVNAKGQTALDVAKEAQGGNRARVIQLLGDGGGGK